SSHGMHSSHQFLCSWHAERSHIFGTQMVSPELLADHNHCGRAGAVFLGTKSASPQTWMICSSDWRSASPPRSLAVSSGSTSSSADHLITRVAATRGEGMRFASSLRYTLGNCGQ